MVGNTENPRVGTLVGGIYRLIGVLRTTPSARTFTGRSGRDGRLVVVKVLRVDGVESSQARARFEAQISIASTLSHPGICPVVDSGIARDGSIYAVMPWFKGATLGEILVKGALTTERTVDLCVQLLSALDYAHGLGVVHRDLKPSNIFIERNANQERAVLLDFGISCRRFEEDSRVTRTGTALGTPCYMAPEQLDAKRVDHRADLFSMGVVAYQCLTGSLPATLSAMLWQNFPSAHGAMLTVRNHAPHVSEALEAVVMRALAHDPNRRFASARAMASAFESAMIAPRSRPCSDKTTRNLPVGDKDWAS